MTRADPPLVSIITPAYNCSSYLVRTVNSVRSQTFDRWEHLIVEDGSIDGTLEVARSAVAEDRRARVLRHPDGDNHGVSATRNLGLAEARGSLVAFLDADDEWHPEMLAHQTSMFERGPSTVLAYAQAQCVDSDGNKLQHPDWPHMEWIIGHAPAPGLLENPFGDFISKKASIPIVAALARRADVIDAGGFVTTLRHQVEDAVLLASLCRSGAVYFNDTILALYRVHSQSYTASLTSLSDADSVWELYRELDDPQGELEPALASEMLGCIDRYLTARAVPWKTRWQRARSVGEHLTRHGIASATQVRVRLLAAFPVNFKRRLAVAVRRWSRIGPTPVRSVNRFKPS